LVGIAEWVVRVEEEGRMERGRDGGVMFIEEEKRLNEVRLDLDREGVRCGISATRRRTDGKIEEVIGEVL